MLQHATTVLGNTFIGAGLTDSFLSKFTPTTSTSSAIVPTSPAQRPAPLTPRSFELTPEWRFVGYTVLAGVAGAIVGGALWRDHWVLGALTGFGVAGAVPSIVRTPTALNVASVAVPAVAGVVAAKAWDRHPVLGWTLAGVAANAAFLGLRLATRQ